MFLFNHCEYFPFLLGDVCGHDLRCWFHQCHVRESHLWRGGYSRWIQNIDYLQKLWHSAANMGDGGERVLRPCGL